MRRSEFPAKVKVAAFERAEGFCEQCTARLRPGNIEYDHILPCAHGGEGTLDNCQVLCRACHRAKTSKDVTAIAKSKRVERKNINADMPSRSRLPGGRGDRWKRKVGGRAVLRETD